MRRALRTTSARYCATAPPARCAPPRLVGAGEAWSMGERRKRPLVHWLILVNFPPVGAGEAWSLGERRKRPLVQRPRPNDIENRRERKTRALITNAPRKLHPHRC